MFLMWYSDNPKHTQEQKIRDAAEAYSKHFGSQPNLALVNPAEVVEVEGMVVRPASYVRKNNVWMGWEPQP